VGRVVLIGRLALRDLRRRPVEAVLLLLAIMAATTTLTLGLALRGVTDSPYQRTREATAGPDVVASAGPDFVPTSNRVVVDDEGRRRPADGAVVPADVAGLEALAEEPGVVAHSGPYPTIVADLEADGLTTDVWAQGHDPAGAVVDRPELTAGRWVEPGGVVVESAFADVLDVDVGDRLALDGRRFEVVGVAATAAAMPYGEVCFGWDCGVRLGRPPVRLESPPLATSTGPPVDVGAFPFPPEDAGLVWLTEEDLRGLAVEQDLLSYVVNLKLADPAAARAFAVGHAGSGITTEPVLLSWYDLRDAFREQVEVQGRVLVPASWLLAVLGVASIAVLVGGRLADQTRRVGLLKAVGGTPRLVAAVLLAEYLVLALVAAAGGLAVGWLAAPLFTDAGAGLLGSAGAPSLTPSTVGVVTAVAVGVATVASFVPAVRAASTSTVEALADQARPPRRTPWLIALSARLPVPLLLGLRTAARRPRRMVLSALSIVVTVSGIVAILATRNEIAREWKGPSQLNPDVAQADRVLGTITVMAVALAAVNAIFVTWTTVVDARHSSALARALGATPRDVSTALSAAQVLPALAGAMLAIPGGLALWSVLSNEASHPPWWQLLAVVPVTVLVVAALSIVPARLGARRPAGEILQAELA
jgi:ABC-type lipoprotein release transport system permease subunit